MYAAERFAELMAMARGQYVQSACERDALIERIASTHAAELRAYIIDAVPSAA